MRIITSNIPIPNTSFSTVEVQTSQDVTQLENPVLTPNADLKVSEVKLQQAIDSINEFFTINNSELKFVFHEGLDTYYAQLINSETEEVIREIPSKKVLDVFYEMQKLVGMIVDKKI